MTKLNSKLDGVAKRMIKRDAPRYEGCRMEDFVREACLTAYKMGVRDERARRRASHSPQTER